MRKFTNLGIGFVCLIGFVGCGDTSSRLPIEMGDRNGGLTATLSPESTTHKVGTEKDARYCLKFDSLINGLGSKYPQIEARTYITDLRLLDDKAKRTEQQNIKAFENPVAQARALELNAYMFDILAEDNLANVDSLIDMHSIKQEACESLSYIFNDEKVTLKIEQETFDQNQIDLYSPENNQRVMSISRSSQNGISFTYYSSISLAELNDSAELEKCQIKADSDSLDLLVVQKLEWGELNQDVRVSAELLRNFDANLKKFTSIGKKLKLDKPSKKNKTERNKVTSTSPISISVGKYNSYVNVLKEVEVLEDGELADAFNAKCN